MTAGEWWLPSWAEADDGSLRIHDEDHNEPDPNCMFCRAESGRP